MEGKAGNTELDTRDGGNMLINNELKLYLLGSILHTISSGFLSHSPVTRQVAVNIPPGNSSCLQWKVTCVPGIAGTE